MEVEEKLHAFLTLKLYEGEWSASRSDDFTLGQYRTLPTAWEGG